MKLINEKYYDPRCKWDKSKWDEVYKKPDPFTYLGDFNEIIRNKIVVDFVKWANNSSVLDVGCGEGTLTKEISNFVKNIAAFDISANAISLAKKNNNSPNIKYFDLDASEYRARGNKYDLVLCSEMIYYLSRNQIVKLFQEIGKSIQINGYFILTTRSSASNNYFTIKEVLALLSVNFKVILITPIWRPDKVLYKIVKRIFGFFSPYSDRIYKSWLMGIDPNKAYMNCFVCMLH